MKQIIAITICVALLSSLFGCASVGTTEGTEANTPPAVNTAEMEIFDALFDIHNTVAVQLDMDDAELEKMQADYEEYDRRGSKSPIYRIANLTVSITTPDKETTVYEIPEVGVRMKGNTSRTDFYSKEEGIYNLIHLKISFQETFDEADYYGTNAKEWTDSERTARKNRTFATLKKLDLRWNRCDDGSYLKEYFAYETYREYGVLAPHVNLCSFDWAGMHMGVYTINEPIDEVFLAKNLPSEALGGDLYKIGWAGSSNGSFTSTNSIGIEDEEAGKFYAYDLKTNKKTSTHEVLINLINSLRKEISKEDFSALVDLDTFLPYCAVSYLLGNPDDLRNNYNNCYIYFRADNGKMMIIPYDFDRCLGITAHWNPTGDGVTSDNPFSADLNADGSPQRSPLMLHSVASGGHYVQEYAALLEKIMAESWFTHDNFSSLYAIAEANYAPFAAPAKEFQNTQGLHLAFDLERTSDFSSYDNISFLEYWEAKMKTLRDYLSNMDQYVGKEPEANPEWYIRSDVTNWKNHSDYKMIQENGLVFIVIKVPDTIRLKVYNDFTGQWFGAECISENCTAAYESDGHTNIVLQQGVYRIVFDLDSETITLTKE